MKTRLIIAIVFLVCPVVASAQLGMRAGQEGQVADAIFDRLFEGFRLTPQQEKSARATILKTLLDEAPLLRVAGSQDSVAALLRRRDSTLLQFVTADADRQRFIERARAMAPKATGRPGGVVRCYAVAGGKPKCDTTASVRP